MELLVPNKLDPLDEEPAFSSVPYFNSRGWFKNRLCLFGGLKYTISSKVVPCCSDLIVRCTGPNLAEQILTT